MSIKYKAAQSNVETAEGKKLWYPQLITEGETVYLPKIAQRIVSKSALSYGDIFNVVYSLIEELNDNLLRGNSVCLDKFGTFRLSAQAKGQGVENPEDVNASQIKSLRVLFTPTATRTSFEGTTRAMLQGAEFVRWKGDPYHPENIRKAGGGSNTGDGDDDGGGGFTPDPNA